MTTAAVQLRHHQLPNVDRTHRRQPPGTCHPETISLSSTTPITATTLSLLAPRSTNPDRSLVLGSPDLSLGGSEGKPPFSGSGGGGGGGDRDRDRDDDSSPPPSSPGGPLGLFLEGWRSRVAADPEFPFKVLMEEIVGVSANVLGDMASRPGFGLSELDFVFSTLVVGSIVNFVLMYLLAPTSTLATTASSLPSHFFAPGSYALTSRIATLFTKGLAFAVVGFAAGLAGTGISNGLLALRKKLDSGFVTNNKPPPTVLNALTWAAHMGVSSNLRYQTLNGVEFAMAKALPPPAFKAAVVVLRCLNNLLGGMTFVMLARITGSQKVEEKGELVAGESSMAPTAIAVEDGGDAELRRNHD